MIEVDFTRLGVFHCEEIYSNSSIISHSLVISSYIYAPPGQDRATANHSERLPSQVASFFF